MMQRMPVQHLLQHFNLCSLKKKGPVLAKQNLYLSSAKALQPHCLSLSAAESIRISSACDTRCLGGKFNYFSLIRCTIPFCGIFCKEEPRWEGSSCLSLATRVARAIHLKSALFSSLSSPSSALTPGAQSLPEIGRHILLLATCPHAWRCCRPV